MCVDNSACQFLGLWQSQPNKAGIKWIHPCIRPSTKSYSRFLFWNDILKTHAARITKLDVEMFNCECWKPIKGHETQKPVLVLRQNVILPLTVYCSFPAAVLCRTSHASDTVFYLNHVQQTDCRFFHARSFSQSASGKKYSWHGPCHSCECWLF